QRLADATVHLARRYIATRINTLVLRRDCDDCDAVQRQQQLQLVDQLLQQLTPHLAILLHRGTPQEKPWDYTLFVVHQAEAFNRIFLNHSSAEETQDREFYFLVVLMAAHQSDSALRVAVRHICYKALKHRVINVVVLAQRLMGEQDDDGEEGLSIYAYKLFNERCEPNITAFESNRFLANGELLRPELFTLRFTNLVNCGLNVTGHQLPPHFMYRPADGAPLPIDGAFIDTRDLRGIDGELLHLLAKALHFRVHLKIPHEKSEIFGADTLNGCFAQLAAGVADIAIGGFSGSDARRKQFATSVVYHQSYFIFVVRKEPYFGPFGQLARPFGGQVWFWLLCFCALWLISIRCLPRRLRPRHALEFCLASIIGNPLPAWQLPRLSSLRGLLGSWLLLTLVLRCAYQAKLFDVLRSPRYQQLPCGLSGLLKQNYTLISTGYHDFYPTGQTHVNEGNFSQRYKAVQEAPPGARLATISLLNNLAHWNMRHRTSSRLTHVREPIYLFQLVIYFPHNSIFKFTFDRKINQLLSSGVLSHIERKYLHVAFADIGNELPLSPRITNALLMGVYRCYVAMMGVASGLLLLERLALRWRHLRRVIDWMQR
ncbi:hypothetical protein KR222_009801, partial [Zaprionus bogoriensis]